MPCEKNQWNVAGRRRYDFVGKRSLVAQTTATMADSESRLRQEKAIWGLFGQLLVVARWLEAFQRQIILAI